ncbi:MAG: ArsR family transcriptional regulator [Candidatus Binatia bacterium]|nr:ArsR family transcriptional regulator [Candidatus Binatia bacterium]
MAETIRQGLLRLLRGEPKSARELSQALGIPEKEVVHHLRHVPRSLAHGGEQLSVEPAECLACGFRFQSRERLSRPTRCPRCHGSHLKAPRYSITGRS